jgi:hypothetical protein
MIISFFVCYTFFRNKYVRGMLKNLVIKSIFFWWPFVSKNVWWARVFTFGDQNNCHPSFKTSFWCMKKEETEKLKDKVKYIGRIACIYLSVLPWKFFRPYYCLFYFPRPVILNVLDIDLYNLPIHDEINERSKKISTIASFNWIFPFGSKHAIFLLFGYEFKTLCTP